MKKTLIILCCGLVLVGGFYVLQTPRVPERKIVLPTETGIVYKKKEIVLGSSTFVLEIADTPALKERGLSYRTQLTPHTGMLFVFDTPAPHYFWMKDMNFPIDIIWLDRSKKVVHIEKNLSPETYPKSFGPETLTQYVIEIQAGLAENSALKVGDIINF